MSQNILSINVKHIHNLYVLFEYKINDFKSGYYFLTYVDANNDTATKEFDRLARNSKDIIRHLITNIED